MTLCQAGALASHCKREGATLVTLERGEHCYQVKSGLLQFHFGDFSNINQSGKATLQAIGESEVVTHAFCTIDIGGHQSTSSSARTGRTSWSDRGFEVGLELHQYLPKFCVKYVP